MKIFGMNILERYIGKSILTMIFAVLLAISGLIFIVKLVEEFKDVSKGSYDAVTATYYALLMLPSDIKEIIPVVVLIGGLLGLGNLASRSELVVMQASGFSRFRIGLAVMKTALPLIFLTMCVQLPKAAAQCWQLQGASGQKMGKILSIFAISIMSTNLTAYRFITLITKL